MAFPITCPSCGKGFQLATEIYERKVAGKVVSIKCKQCHAGIRVDATTPGELKVAGVSGAAAGADSAVPKQPSISDDSQAGKGPLPVRARQPTLLGMAKPGSAAAKAAAERAAPPPPAPPPPPEALWAVDAGDGGDDRELTDEQMKREIETGKLLATTLVWREGQGDWQEIQNVALLAQYLPANKPPAPRPRLPSAPGVDAPRPRSPSAPGFDVPRVGGGEDEEDATMIYDRSAGNAPKLDLPELPPEYEPPAPLPPPVAPAASWNVAPGILSAGAKGAGSAPKAAPPPLRASAPQAAAAPVPPPLAQVAPPPLAPAPPPLAPAPPPLAPAAAPEFPAPNPFAAPSAPAAAPRSSAPPAPRMPQAAIPWGPGAPPPAASPSGVMAPNPFAVAATTTDLDFPKPKSKLPLVIGALVVIGAIVGIAVAVTRSGSAPGPVATPAAAPPAPPGPPTPAATETATAAPEATTTGPTGEARPSNQGGDPLAAPGPAPKAGGGFSEMFAAGMEKAEKSGSAQSPGHPFDQEEAKRAVAATLRKVASCKEPGSPTGQTVAAVTFESSGKVSSVTIGAPFAGTSTGTCMVTAFKQVTIAPFAGLPGTVSQAVSLR